MVMDVNVLMICATTTFVELPTPMILLMNNMIIKLKMNMITLEMIKHAEQSTVKLVYSHSSMEEQSITAALQMTLLVFHGVLLM